jgi:ABC-type multidrug transport system permease subunit
MFFLMVSMGFAAARLVADRERRVIERISIGRPLLPVLLGRACAGVAVGGLSVLVMSMSTMLFFGRTWGPAPYVALVTVVVVVAFSAMAAVAASLSRTTTQAQMATVGLAFLFAVTSGFFSPPGAAVSSELAHYVPTTFALNAYQALATGDLAFAAFGVNLLVLVAFAGAAVGVAAFTSRKVI